jgi:hypothetical protein
MQRDPLKAPIAIGVIAALVALAGACSRKPTEPATTPATATPPVAAATTQDAEPARSAQVHGLRKQMNRDVPVFVDGKQVGVLRYGELPPGSEPITIPSNSHQALRYYRVSDYLAGIGVNVDRVKAVHFADKNDRIASLEGSELRADKDRFVFDFTATTGGMPEMVWNTVGLKTKLRVDYFYAVNVFVAKTPWEIDRREHCYREDGECRPVASFSDDPLMKGTRVYVDGKLVSYVKRRLLSDSALASKATDDESVFSTDKYLSSLGIKTADVKRIELVSSDAVIASASASEWAADAERLTFRLVRHAHGKVRANIPANLQAKSQREPRDREAQVTAIEVFSHKDPRSVPIVSLDRVIDLGSPPEGALAQTAVDEDPQD